MYVLMCPCISDPACRAQGITTISDIELFTRCIERCRHFGIEIVSLPCPETEYLGSVRKPTNFLKSLDTPEFSALLDEKEAEVRRIIEKKGAPIAIIGVDSSPSCGVNQTYYSEKKRPGRGAFLTRFPEILAMDVKDFSAYRIYLAGPLFTEAETDYNLVLHKMLTEHLFDVYLPQEVGDTSQTRGKDEHREIFNMHVRALENSDIIVAVVDGADADSGTSWEMGYATALGKRVVSLRTDFRHAGHHELVNLMLEQSSEIVRKKEDLPVLLNSPLV
ncbi:MAG: nucleoside 2-deoxyribosyltransferase [Methanogenium sp.]|nr:nucleoside 2-deoxyribosyltransferase [Methanogenium sp.]